VLVRILGQPKRSGPFSPQAPPKPATRLLLHQPGAGDVIGMTVGIHRVEQFQVQFAKQGQVTIHLLEHRVDDHGLPGVLIREYVGICRGGGIKQLLEDHDSQGTWRLVK